MSAPLERGFHNLRAYHLPDGEMFEPVTPVPLSRTRLVAISEQDAEVLENVGQGLCRLAGSVYR